MQRDAIAEVLDAVELLRRRAANHPVHVVALLEQELGEVRAVLTGDPRYERGARAGHRRRSLAAAGESPARA